MIDFRSDTVTKPSKEMLEVMFNAPVGDDVYGEDPSVNELQIFAAKLFGKDAALFCTSGTQTNQIAINVHVKPGGEVICHEDSHVYKYEGGGIAKNSGASVRLTSGAYGQLNPAELHQYIQPDDVHFPITQLVSIEDTANRGGGAVYNFETIQQLRKITQENSIPLHLDGARVFNALTHSRIPIREYAANFDSISVCLSKGLGAPVGSLLLGSHAFIAQAKRVRKVMGGGMRQAGYLAAAGLFALKNNVQRLSIDHEHAKMIESALQNNPHITQILPVHTNIVIFHVVNELKRNEIISKLSGNGVLVSAFGPTAIRLVTHLDISTSDIEQTIQYFSEL